MNASDETLLLACDAGQSGVRLALVQDNKLAKEVQFPGLLTNQDLFPQLATAINDALEGQHLEVTVAIGTTGLIRANANPEKLLALLRGNVRKVYLAHDSITGILGSIGLQSGTMTAVGTGVVTLSVGTNGIARVDGWGNLIGDCGSAYWIGRAGLERALKAYDGRLPETRLSELLKEGFSHPEEAYIELQGSPDRVSRIASFARHVIEVARFDTAAMEIVTEAASELALSAFTAARKTGNLESAEPLFSWVGNVMRADVMRSEFEFQLRSYVPAAKFVSPIGEPIDGVLLLPRVPASSLLYGEIHQASV